MLNIFKNILITFVLIFSSANALELGQLKVTSHLNEPLKANFTLDHIAAENLGDIILSLADQKTYQSMGLEKSYYLSKLKFKIIAGQGSQHIVQISTTKRVREPILDILVKVSEKQSSLTRQYTLMLDPRDYSGVEPVVSSHPVVKSVEKTVATIPANKVDVTNSRKQNISRSTNSIRVENDSISIIAQNSPLHEKYSVYQIMRAFYLLNSTEFNLGNINNLKSASTLIIPDEKLVSEVSRQKSINFVYSVSKNNPSRKLIEIPAELIPEQQSEKTTQGSQNEAQPIKVEPVVMAQSTGNTDQQLNERMVSDVKAWRTVSAEFKTLSSVVQNQNDAIKIQSTVIQKIAAQLEQKNQQIEMINIRLGVLENSRLTGSSPVSNEGSVNMPLGRSQNGLLIQQTEVVNGRITDSLEEINIIKNRLDALEAPVKGATVESMATPEGATLEVPVIKIIQDPQIQANRFNTFMIWAVLLLAVIILLLLSREIMWRRRMKLLSNTKEIEQTETIKDVEHRIKEDDTDIQKVEFHTREDDTDIQKVEFHTREDDTDIPETVELQKVTQTVDIIEAETVDTNAQLMDINSEQSIDFNLEFTEEPSTQQHAEFNEQPKIETLYAEIDVLIAYQLYDEAFELLKNARKTFDSNGCLDIRELELLAYTKNVDAFLPKFEERKESLSKEFPDEWIKIEELNEKLIVEFIDDSNIISFK